MDFCPETPGKPKNNGVGSLFILWGILLTQESNLVSCITDGYFSSWAAREAPNAIHLIMTVYQI